MKNDFYYQLNQSHQYIQNQIYIDLTTKIMKSVLIKQDPKDKLLVIGAGNLSDFNLDYFLSLFSKVFLTDIDHLSMEKALKERVNHPKIKVKQLDYIGSSISNIFDDFQELVYFKDYERVQQFFDKQIKKLKTYKFSEYFDFQFDTIYISPIYTQLLYREVEAHLQGLTERGFSIEFKDKILKKLLQDMVSIIDHFNREVESLLKENGSLFVGSDVFYLTNDDFSIKVKENIDDQIKMEKIYLEYRDKRGYGLGDYGLYSLSQVLNLINEKWVLWGKNSSNSYAVKFCVMTKR